MKKRFGILLKSVREREIYKQAKYLKFIDKEHKTIPVSKDNFNKNTEVWYFVEIKDNGLLIMIDV
jgi:hypothetical protein